MATARSTAAAGAFFLLATLSSFAADAEPTNTALSEALFDQGRALMEGGHYDEACEKLAYSQRLDPAGGTILNLALCHEKQGRVATAWTEYREALGTARRDGREDRTAFAEQHIVALEKQVPRISIAVASAATPLQLRLDGATLDRAAFGVAIPVDPGRHVLQASAVGREPWQRELVARPGDEINVTVPMLATAIPSEQTPPVASARSGRKTLGFTLLGISGAAIVTGAVFGVLALDAGARSRSLCPSSPCSNDEGVQLSRNAGTDAWVANGALAGGIIAGAIGLYLLVSTPSGSASSVRTAGDGFRNVAWSF
jgi:hypothetical protein